MRTAAVVLDKAAPAYDRIYTYRLPDGMDEAVGCRVLVPFGAGNRTRLGLVLSMEEQPPNDRLKDIRARLDSRPLLDAEGLSLLHVLHERTFCTWFDAVRALIPPGAGMRISMGLSAVRGQDPAGQTPDAARLYAHLLTRRKLIDENDALAAIGLTAGHPAAQELVDAGFAVREQRVCRRIADERAVMARLIVEEEPKKLTSKQKAVFELLTQLGCASVRELCYFCGVTRAVIDRMRRQELLELFEEVRTRPDATLPTGGALAGEISLSAAQQRAYEALSAIGDAGGSAVSLLYGVTGSGKTRVFLKLIDHVLHEGRGAMVLIPEISLTPQTVALFRARFGERVAVLHSSLTMTERLEQWRRVREGACDIVVGTRSAVFAPMARIGLIVMDEEQEHTYHSERAPRYHAREIAKLRAQTHGAHLLLCSATPSVESYYYATRGRYHLVELPERFSGGELPTVETIDLSAAPMAADSTSISEELSEEIGQNLARGEQTILLLNRRGYSTLLKCSACGEAARCPNCSIPLTFHTANGRMVCHYCGYSRPRTAVCPTCGSEMLRFSGAGTQRAEEELHRLYPTARILRMDADTTLSRDAHQRGFEAFARGEYDLMIGTQMVAKGLNFPRVTLVGVLFADQSLYAEDFRSFERTFSLITQVVGRGGRADLPGRAVIQTFTPDHRVLTLAATQQYGDFFREEIEFRRVGLYPPFCEIVCMMFSAEKESAAQAAARDFCARLTAVAKQQYPTLPLRVLGPAECNPYRAAGRFRMRILLKCKNDRPTRDLLHALSDWYHSQKEYTASLSVDPYYDSNV